MEKKTVKYIKDECIKLGRTPPGGLLKAELIEFYKELKRCKKKGLSVEQELCFDEVEYTSVYCKLKKEEDWVEHLNRKGWATVPVPDFKPGKAMYDFYNWMEGIEQPTPPEKLNSKEKKRWLKLNTKEPFDRTNKETWSNLPANYHGIFVNYIGHEEFIWEARESCYLLFKELLNTKKLVCSFDGACFYPYNNKKEKSWFHSDHARKARNTECYQGLVNLLDNGPKDGGLLLYEKSHKIYDKYLDKYTLEGFTSQFKVNIKDPLLEKLKVVKVCAPAGHMIIWNGKTFHCNTKPTRKKGLRACIYVSMQPKKQLSEKDKEKRIKAFESTRMTGHWCSGKGLHVRATHPFTYGKPYPKPDFPLPKPKLNKLRKKLIGV